MATMQLSMFALDDDPAPEAPETYYLGTCTRCRRTHRATADRTTVYGARRYVECTQCSSWTNSVGVRVAVHPIRATYHAGTRCDARCMSATGHTCECSCNGKNHGRWA